MKDRFLVVLAPMVVALGCGATSMPAMSSAELTSATAPSFDRFQASFFDAAKQNDAYRHVLFTGAHSQLAVMAIPPGGDVGLESHAGVDVVIFLVSGEGTAIVHGVESTVHGGDVLVTGANTTHNIINTGAAPLRMLTVSSPPNHLDGRLQVTKRDAERDTADHEFAEGLENKSLDQEPTLSRVRPR